MNIMRNLPAFLALLAGTVLAVISVYYRADFKEMSVKLIIGITVFYLLGYLIRGLVFHFLFLLLRESEEKVRLTRVKNMAHGESNSYGDMDNDDFAPYIPKNYTSNVKRQ